MTQRRRNAAATERHDAQVGDDIPVDEGAVARLYDGPSGPHVRLADPRTGAELGRAPLADRTEEAVLDAVATLLAARAAGAAQRTGPAVSSLVGVEARVAWVDARVARGLPEFNISGPPEAALRELRTRVRAAMEQSGFPFPSRRVQVSVGDGEWRIRGTSLDLGVAVGVLVATGECPPEMARGWMLFGELALSGKVRGARGAYPAVRAAAAAGLAGAVVPPENALEAAAAAPPGFPVVCAESLQDARDFMAGARPLREASAYAPHAPAPPAAAPLEGIYGHELGKLALEAAAAGGHNLLFVSPPGSGATMLARALAGILPPPTPAEVGEIASIYSASGLGYAAWRPFRAPHHSASALGLSGNVDRPGELCLADRGVLFLDELPEFSRESLETLRGPLDDGEVVAVGARERVAYPASFTLVASMAPCPCGWEGDRSDRCECSQERVRRYRDRVAGRLLDRIALRVRLSPVGVPPHRGPHPGPTTAGSAARVLAARAAQARRGVLNDRATLATAAALGPVSPAAAEVMRVARGLHLRRVARTVADLDGSDAVELDHVRRALPLCSAM